MDQNTNGVTQIELQPTTNRKITSQHVMGTFNFLPQGMETMPTSEVQLELGFHNLALFKCTLATSLTADH
jgi:hypothetical protein